MHAGRLKLAVWCWLRRAQIRCSVFKIIDNQDEMEAKNSRQTAKSALHWENSKARELMTHHGAISGLVAELIREYLEFYALDYTKQIFVPESGLDVKGGSRTRNALAADANLPGSDVKKPLLVQIIEKFVAGEAPAGPSDFKRDSPEAVYQ